MLGAIHMPTWLVDFWTVYGDMITPVLVTLVTALITALSFKIKSDAKINAEKAELQLKALEKMADKEDNKPQINSLTEQVSELKTVVKYQSEIINLAFQNSNLDPEIKSNLASLTNKSLYGTEDNLISALEEDNKALQEEIAALKEQLAAKIPEMVKETIDTRKRTRR
jgi:phage I-like protein